MSDRDRFLAALTSALARINLTLSAPALDALWRHFTLLLEANQRLNLTRITDPVDAALRHYADSLAVIPFAVQHFPRATTLLDVGTGGGFPALPLAVARPDWRIIAVDATAKKVAAVASFIDALALTNISAVQARPPAWKSADRFDLVLARAVGAIAACLDAARPYVAPGGAIVCYKTAHAPDDELRAAHQWCRRTRWRALPPWDYTLHDGELPSPRRLLAFVKEK
jgi:16S rRNA (guanine527-N7)-methyltransferase